MRTRVAWLAILVCASWRAPIAAQAMLSEADAIARLSAESARTRAIRSAVDVARAETLGVGRWPNPRLTIDRESVAGVSETLTTVLQPLPVTGRRGLERAAAEALAESVSHRAAAAMRRARADLRLAYADLVAAQRRERELSRSRDRLEELARILERREAAGDAAGFDRLRADREVLDADADRELAAVERTRAQARLAGFFAAGTDAGLLVAEERAPAVPEIPPLEMLVQHSERTGEGFALQKEIEAGQLAGEAADRRRFPEPELMAGMKTSSAGRGDRGGVFGVQATLPLFDHGGPERGIAQARAAQATASLEAFRIALRAEVSAARTAAVERRRAAERYRASGVQTAGDLERIAQVSYDAGERGILELLDAHRLSSSARVRQAALDAAARAAEIELEFVSGWEIP